MARLPRVFLPGLTMHVIQRGASRADVFRDAADYELFLEMLRTAAECEELTIHVFVLMTNHLHLMVTPQTPTSLPRTMQQVGRLYVPYFNHRYERTGTLWQSRYRAIAVDTERYWLTCLRYVELNPVRACMVQQPEEYEWSSYHAHAFGRWLEWLVPHQAYLALGATDAERQEAYRAICAEAMPACELEDLRYAAHHGWAYGAPEFVRRIEQASGRRVSPRAAGRRSQDVSLITIGV